MSKFAAKIQELEHNIQRFNQPWTTPEKWIRYCEKYEPLKQFKKSPANFISIQDYGHHRQQDLPENILIARVGAGEFSLLKFNQVDIETTYFLPSTKHQNPTNIELPGTQISAALRLSKRLNEQLALNLAIQSGKLQEVVAPNGWLPIVQTWQRTFPKNYTICPFKQNEKCNFNLYNAQWEADAILQDKVESNHFYLIEAKTHDCQLFKSKLYYPSMLAFHFLGQKAKKITPMFFVGKQSSDTTISFSINLCKPIYPDSKIEDLSLRS